MRSRPRLAVLLLVLVSGIAWALPAATALAGQQDDDDVEVLAYYVVHGDELGHRTPSPAAKKYPAQAKDEKAHRRIWDLFARLTPPAYDGLVTVFQVLSDESDAGAYVSQADGSGTAWVLGVQAALAYHPHELRHTLVHEFAHLVSLNATQVPGIPVEFDSVPEVLAELDRIERECTTYYTGVGCSLESSYIFRFVDRFWNDRLDEWNDLQQIESDRRHDDAIHRFYERHRDEFVNSYAATKPLEDFAQTFARYVLRDSPTRSRVRDDKVRFFDEFPDLVALRTEIRDALED